MILMNQGFKIIQNIQTHLLENLIFWITYIVVIANEQYVNFAIAYFVANHTIKYYIRHHFPEWQIKCPKFTSGDIFC